MYKRQILQYTLETVKLFGFTLLFALPLGLVLAFGRMSKFWPVQWLTRLYLLVMRGTPLMLQLIFFWFGLKLGSTIGFSRMETAILAFSLNYAAYFAEIYRGGIEGVPHGQWEAANVLGFSRAQTFFRIILPQVIKRVLPPMSNEFMLSLIHIFFEVSSSLLRRSTRSPTSPPMMPAAKSTGAVSSAASR